MSKECGKLFLDVTANVETTSQGYLHLCLNSGVFKYFTESHAIPRTPRLSPSTLSPQTNVPHTHLNGSQ